MRFTGTVTRDRRGQLVLDVGNGPARAVLVPENSKADAEGLLGWLVEVEVEDKAAWSMRRLRRAVSTRNL